MNADVDVLVVGAGPTGLVLALWLTRLGVRVRIVDKTAEPVTTSRAVGVQARTLELYRQIGLADTIVDLGVPAGAANIWVAGRHVARAVLGDIGAGISQYPFALLFAQDEHERLLIARLREMGVDVDRGTELLDFEEGADRAIARLRKPDGSLHAFTARYIAGCDGAHSAVRETLKIGFAGGTYAHLFYVADVNASGPAMNGEVHVALDRADFLAAFPLKGARRARLVGTIRREAERDQEQLSWDDVSRRVIEWMRIDIARVNWFSTYHVHHRVAERFRRGRAFLLGDAAHVHSPVGAQGMNTGIGDAVNLAWKLAAVLRDRADPAILDTYQAERIAFARRLVATTDRAFTGITSPGALARALRLHIVPLLLPPLFAVRAVRRFMFRTISQTAITYRGSALSAGGVGPIAGGDRLPWVRTSADGSDNYATLTSLEWHVHVYGEAAPDLRATCEQRGLSLHLFAWQPVMFRSGLRRNAVYLVRPDGYIALASRASLAARRLASYLDARRLSPSRPGVAPFSAIPSPAS
jgi:2-polyprenyl-6-methoxyphenol hydroxylase-like FAD-dependent oxidoreductase